MHYDSSKSKVSMKSCKEYICTERERFKENHTSQEREKVLGVDSQFLVDISTSLLKVTVGCSRENKTKENKTKKLRNVKYRGVGGRNKLKINTN